MIQIMLYVYILCKYKTKTIHFARITWRLSPVECFSSLVRPTESYVTNNNPQNTNIWMS